MNFVRGLSIIYVYFFPLKNIRIRRSKRKGCPANGSRLKGASEKKLNGKEMEKRRRREKKNVFAEWQWIVGQIFKK